jgi:hypothetical protein
MKISDSSNNYGQSKTRNSCYNLIKIALVWPTQIKINNFTNIFCVPFETLSLNLNIKHTLHRYLGTRCKNICMKERQRK